MKKLIIPKQYWSIIDRFSELSSGTSSLLIFSTSTVLEDDESMVKLGVKITFELTVVRESVYK